MPDATLINRVLYFWSGHKQVRDKSQILVINRVRVLGSGPHTHTQFFLGVATPPPPPPMVNIQGLFVIFSYLEIVVDIPFTL